MRTLHLTYHLSYSPHTYGVRLGPCGSFATEPCRPTACTQHATPAPYPSSDHCSLLTAHWTYTFSAKEKDVETGLSYFGSRYYSSDLSIWLSVDPMSDKYASLSPYNYCANNPVKLVDPNGEEWYVNEDGYIKCGNNVEDHNVYFVKGKLNDFGENQRNSKGDVVSVDIGSDMARGIVEDYGNYKDIHDNNKIKPYTSHSFKISDLETARQLFKCMSKYTDVEFSFWGDNNGFHLSTSHISWTDIYGGNKAKDSGEAGKLSFFFHSHPRKEENGMYTNDLDRNTRDACLRGSPNAVIGIIHRGILYNLETFIINWDGTRKD